MRSIIDKALQAVLKMLKKKDERVLLWQNASPSSDFAAQTIKLSLKDYDAILLKHKYTKATAYYGVQFIEVGDSATVYQIASAKAASLSYLSRDVKVTTSGVTIEAGYGKTIYSTSAGGASASNLIPVEIYGVKGVK